MMNGPLRRAVLSNQRSADTVPGHSGRDHRFNFRHDIIVFRLEKTAYPFVIAKDMTIQATDANFPKKIEQSLKVRVKCTPEYGAA